MSKHWQSISRIQPGILSHPGYMICENCNVYFTSAVSLHRAIPIMRIVPSGTVSPLPLGFSYPRVALS